jgi:hypothetical protein
MPLYEVHAFISVTAPDARTAAQAAERVADEAASSDPALEFQANVSLDDGEPELVSDED